MGLLVNGTWQDKWYDTEGKGGHFVRERSQFRNQVTTDGSSQFPAESGRYHLYVSLACPWAHRTLIFRNLKHLTEVISVSIVDWYMGENGWQFSKREGATPDTENGRSYLYEIYTLAQPSFTGRVTVPVLWDKVEKTVVNNESSEIIRMFNSAFDAWGDKSLDFYPEDLRSDIDALNARVYDTINNGVYKAGFATRQSVYETAFDALFVMLDELEERLSRQRYLLGSRLTEADWRLFTTLIRFDPVYYGHFKCNKRRITDYPNLWGYVRDLYQHPGVAETVNFKHIKGHYYESHPTINPPRIIPKGPDIDFAAPHGRAALSLA